MSSFLAIIIPSWDSYDVVINIQNDVDQHVGMSIHKLGYSGAYISGKIVAIGSNRFQMIFDTDPYMDTAQNGAIMEIDKNTWKYD